MTILTKQAVLFIREGEQFQAPNGYIGPCPDWVPKTRQFKEMVTDGMIVAAETTKDKDLAAADKPVKVRRGSKVTEE